MTKCGAGGFSEYEGKVVWWECKLEEGHSETVEIPDMATDKIIKFTRPTPHDPEPVSTKPKSLSLPDGSEKDVKKPTTTTVPEGSEA